jgi:CRP-like cAMP-binding protein
MTASQMTASGLTMQSSEDVARFVRHYRPGAVIVREGQPAEAVYLVQQGEVIHSRRDQTCSCHRSQPGELFGEAALADGAPYAATAHAVGDCAVLVLSPDTLERVIGKSPNIGGQILRQLSERVRQAERRLELGRSENPEVRVAEGLLEAARRACRGSAPKTEFGISPVELAEWVLLPIDSIRHIVDHFVERGPLDRTGERFELEFAAFESFIRAIKN